MKPKAEEEHDFKGVETRIEGFYRGIVVRSSPPDDEPKQW